MAVIVRDFRPDDPEDVAGVLSARLAALPHVLLLTPAYLRYRVQTALPEEHLRILVAEEDGQVVGAGETHVLQDSPVPGQGSANPQVSPEHRGRGAGSLLLRAAEEHLAAAGVTDVFSWALDEPGPLAFAARRGYRPGRASHFQHLDLATARLDEPGPLPAGVRLRTFADYALAPRVLFAADAEVTADEPGDVAQELADFDDWLTSTWHDPRLDHALTSVVEVEGQVASFSLAHTDGGTRYRSGMTGTLRAFRGRGFALLAKTDSLRRAREAGCTDAYTGNDTRNAPMLAVNRRLGYRVLGTEVRHVKHLG
ncbi:GNAT family N-acetyltransferase [Streptomyces fuscigenes]|uniref:GNAT family N-acetyltransferase n=1 Tax=Streptomyces fuscigenes TaxID=1528880 RepID=UPI001F1E81B2|nr:GNAT family N-acetyltransferase [Streptomyces fuscigenes]MCF3962403.1 GNAT family N-acetyltransferase [Streptomyces fuscigenes]